MIFLYPFAFIIFSYILYMSFYKKYLKYKKKYIDLKIQMGGALKPWEIAAQAKEAEDLQNANIIFNERFKTNEEFERIKNNVWDELIELNTSLNERCEKIEGQLQNATERKTEQDSLMDEIKKTIGKIKKKFNLTRSITNQTEMEHLKNMLDNVLKVSLEKKGIKIKLKLLIVPFHPLHILKRKVKKCVNQTESKRSVNQTESKRSVNQTKSQDEIILERLIKLRDKNEDPVIPLGNSDHIYGYNKISEWLLHNGKDINKKIKDLELPKIIRLETERQRKGLYTYNKFKKDSRSDHLMGLNITVTTYHHEIGNYEPILKDRYIGEKWIFTIVEEKDPTTLTVTGNTDGEEKNPTTLTQTENTDGEDNNLTTFNDIATQANVITTPYFSATQKTDK